MEALLQKPYWVIDWLPEQVPDSAAGQFYAVEQFYLQEERQRELRRRFAGILLRVNCYYDIRICAPEEENWLLNPEPEALADWLTRENKDLCVLLPAEDALITVYRDDLYMTVYNPSGRLLKLLERLVTAAGLFLWQPPQEEEP